MTVMAMTMPMITYTTGHNVQHWPGPHTSALALACHTPTAGGAGSWCRSAGQPGGMRTSYTAGAAVMPDAFLCRPGPTAGCLHKRSTPRLQDTVLPVSSRGESPVVEAGRYPQLTWQPSTMSKERRLSSRFAAKGVTEGLKQGWMERGVIA